MCARWMVPPQAKKPNKKCVTIITDNSHSGSLWAESHTREEGTVDAQTAHEPLHILNVSIVDDGNEDRLLSVSGSEPQWYVLPATVVWPSYT